MAVKVLILEDNPVARSFLCRVVRESFSDANLITEAGDLETARRHIAPPAARGVARPPDPFKLILVDLELPDGNGMELLAELAGIPGHQDRHDTVFRRRAPLPCAAVRRRRLPAEGRPLRGAGRGIAEDRARPAAAVAGHRAPPAHAFPPRHAIDDAPDTGFATTGGFGQSRPIPIEKPRITNASRRARTRCSPT
jgi:two-component system, NarL family, nitrate/nitrite response regulator NarL